MSWIKVRTDLTDDPHVIRLSVLLKCPPHAALGCFVVLWCIADSQSEDGELDGWDTEMLDTRIGAPGFVDAALKGSDGKGKDPWLVRDKDGNLSIPKFDRHMSECAKRRAVDNKRKAHERAVPDSKTKMSEKCPNELGQNSDQIREEKRREENPPPPSGSGAAPLAGGCPSPRKSRRSASVSEPPAFADFWAAYPAARRVGRAAAFRRWSECVRTLVARPMTTDDAHALLADKARAFAASDIGRGEARFIPHPATWLNAGRFDDDPASWKNTQTPQSTVFKPTKLDEPSSKTMTPDDIRRLRSSLASQNGHQATYVAPESTPAVKSESGRLSPAVLPAQS